MFLAGTKMARVLAVGISLTGAAIGAHTMAEASTVCLASVGGAAR
jgi:hypothetical protein